MALHDWIDERGWDSVHQLWIHSLLVWLQGHLPSQYRAYLGSVPGITMISESGRADLSIRAWQPPASPTSEGATALVETPQTDFQTIALSNPEPHLAVHIVCQGKLVAAVELVSPRNKDRPSSREFYRNRYLSYLWSGVHLMLIDVHPRPLRFSFAEAMATELQCRLPVGMPPHIVSWNVGGPTPEGGQFLDGWYRLLAVGSALPSVPLALTPQQALLIDLDSTYSEAAHLAYLDS